MRSRGGCASHCKRARPRRSRSGHVPRTQQKAGTRVVGVYDENALTFIFSSWRFDWEGAAFEGPPLCFDHGALVAIACVFVPRPNGDGLNVYASGPEQSLVAFTKRLLEFVAAWCLCTFLCE